MTAFMSSNCMGSKQLWNLSQLLDSAALCDANNDVRMTVNGMGSLLSPFSMKQY